MIQNAGLAFQPVKHAGLLGVGSEGALPELAPHLAPSWESNSIGATRRSSSLDVWQGIWAGKEHLTLPLFGNWWKQLLSVVWIYPHPHHCRAKLSWCSGKCPIFSLGNIHDISSLRFGCFWCSSSFSPWTLYGSEDLCKKKAVLEEICRAELRMGDKIASGYINFSLGLFHNMLPKVQYVTLAAETIATVRLQRILHCQRTRQGGNCLVCCVELLQKNHKASTNSPGFPLISWDSWSLSARSIFCSMWEQTPLSEQSL